MNKPIDALAIARILGRSSPRKAASAPGLPSDLQSEFEASMNALNKAKTPGEILASRRLGFAVHEKIVAYRKEQKLTALRKDMKAPAPELPAHLKHAADAAIAALDAAKTPAEKAAAHRQGEQATEMLKAHVADANKLAALKIAHSKPQDLTKDFGK